MKTISPDLRTRILSACDRHDRTRQHAADRFGVSPAFVKKLLGRRKRTGFAGNPYFRTGRKQAVSAAKRELMRKYTAKHPGATLAEIARACRPARPVATVDNTLRRMGLTYKKKTLGAAGRDRTDTASERESRNRLSKNRDPVKAVFIDESGVTAKMTRLYGRTINPPGRDGGFAAAVNLLKTVVCERLRAMDARFLSGGAKAAK